MAKTVHDITDSIFKEIGEFGPYQFLVFALVGLVATIPGIVGFSFAFYAATPSFRCKIPGFANDTYEIQNENHQSLIDKFIPFLSDKSFKGIYEGCTVKTFMNSSSSNNFTINYCSEWVFSKEYFESTLVTEVFF
ncbi:organic cation transporter -like [Brachionus plicatilis]|uniref:Organic cation transporter-like n=1 Tax=Brachionus plicatilis TaxID=10195 RepID=A0A3M7PBF2_BRAPC|nr:organic cation transporter -like [Brachionus plicatilis]